MNLIGIVGKIGSGKTTLANILVNHGYTEYSFATPLKKIAEIFGFSKDSLYSSQEAKISIHPKWGISSRHFLQKVGTDIFRNLKSIIPEMKIESSVWVEIFKQSFNKNIKTVISDVRFLDEAKAIKEMNGIIIKIERDFNTYESNHISETEMGQIEPDFIIHNNGTISDLEKQILHYLNEK